MHHLKYVVDFDAGLTRLVRRINAMFGFGYASVKYEGSRRWSVMGTARAEWLEFEVLDGRAFRITKQLSGKSLRCGLRRGCRNIDVDIHNAIYALSKQF